VLHVVVIGWSYVALMMALAEAVAPNGSLLGAFGTFVLYGVPPLAIVLYIGSTPARRRARRAADASVEQPDSGGHPPSDAIAAKREEP
jgi:hypothetical protein